MDSFLGILTSAQDTTILCNDRLCNDTVVSCTSTPLLSPFTSPFSPCPSAPQLLPPPLDMSCGYRCGGFAACDHTVFECTEANCSINCDGTFTLTPGSSCCTHFILVLTHPLTPILTLTLILTPTPTLTQMRNQSFNP